MKKIETVFSPAIFDNSMPFSENYVAVIVDIFRATTCFCVALYQGAKAIIPIVDLEILKQMKEDGYIVAAERNGQKVAFANYGNDPHEYLTNAIVGKEIAYSTTNGTRAIDKAIENNCSDIVIGSFLNLTAIADFLVQNQKDVLIVCAGWKNQFSFEDAFFAGALSECLIMNGFEPDDDATKTAVIMWQAGKTNPIATMEKNSSHLKRLLSLDITNTLPFAMQQDICPIVPIMENGKIHSYKN